MLEISNLETAIGRARGGCAVATWQGATTRRAPACKGAQCRQCTTALRCRVHRAFTHELMRLVSDILKAHQMLPGANRRSAAVPGSRWSSCCVGTATSKMRLKISPASRRAIPRNRLWSVPFSRFVLPREASCANAASWSTRSGAAADAGVRSPIQMGS